MVGGAKGEPFISATESPAEKGAERRATQGKPVSRTSMQVSLPMRLFTFIEPRQGSRFAGRMRRQIDVYDCGMPDFSEGSPPTLGNGSRHIMSGRLRQFRIKSRRPSQ